MSGPVQIKLSIPLAAYLQDYRFMDQPRLPAAEALEALAGAVREVHPQAPVYYTKQARFDRSPPMAQDADTLEAWAEIDQAAGGGISASLQTGQRTKSGAPGKKEHARVVFESAAPAPPPGWDLAWVLEGAGYNLQAQSLYSEMIPLGPAYHNLSRDIRLTPQGGAAWITAPEYDNAHLLGSPFVLEAGFHLASAWGQRYGAVVGFPLGYEQSGLLSPTQPGHEYFCRVEPKGASARGPVFDLWLFSEPGGLCQWVKGLQMGELSPIRLSPPSWVVAPEDEPVCEPGSELAGFVVLEHKELPPFALRVLSRGEKNRAGPMGQRRRSGHLAVRVGLKLLARRLNPELESVLASQLHTLGQDHEKPLLPSGDSRDEYQVSASHDHRFTVAAAAKAIMGIDVDHRAEKAWQGRETYMDAGELGLAEESALAPEEAALRVWSAKEAAAKAFDLNLAQAWNQVRVTSIGESGGTLVFQGRSWPIRHFLIEGHLITVLLSP